MITISNALFAIIMVVSFWIGFAFCAILCINGVTQPEDEAKRDESHSATRYEKPTREQIAAARCAAKTGPCPGNSILHCNNCPGTHYDNGKIRTGFCHDFAYTAQRADAARAWLAAHNLPIEEPER